jgi:hypothetical protein
MFKTINRRMMLRGGGAVLAMPMLEAMLPMTRWGRAAEKNHAAQRLVCIGNPFGFLPELFFPKQVGANYQLPELLKPLAPHREDFTVFSHLDHNLTGGHFATAGFLSGVKVADAPRMREGNITLDQKLAEYVGARTRYPSLNLACGGKFDMSFTRNAVAVPALKNLRDTFDALFTDPEQGQRNSRRDGFARDNSVLDTIREAANQFQRELGKQDQQKLEQYFTSIRELERKLQMAESWLDRPKPVADKSTRKLAESDGGINDLDNFYDLIVLALQTDSSRAITLGISGGNLEDLGLGYGSYHKYSHHGQLPELVNGLKVIEKRQMVELSRFLGKLKEVDDPSTDGSLLGNTLVLCGSGLANGSSHSAKNMPILLAGGGFRHGQHLRYPEDPSQRVPLCNLYVSMLQQLGLKVDSFGTSTGALRDFS